MGHLGVAPSLDIPFQPLHEADVEGFHLFTMATDEVMMMVLSIVKFIPAAAVSKIATADESNLFQSCEASIDGDQIAGVDGKSLMKFLHCEWPMLVGQEMKDVLTGGSDFEPGFAKTFQRLFIQIGMGMGHVGGHFFSASADFYIFRCELQVNFSLIVASSFVTQETFP